MLDVDRDKTDGVPERQGTIWHARGRTPVGRGCRQELRGLEAVFPLTGAPVKWHSRESLTMGTPARFPRLVGRSRRDAQGRKRPHRFDRFVARAA
jgi:hypothetical protein